MPRTRQVKNLDVSKESVLPEKCKDDLESLKKLFLEINQSRRQELIKQKEITLANFRLLTKQKRVTIPIAVGNRSIKDLRQNINWHTMSSVKHCSVLNSILHTGDELSKKKTSDDGYLTSDSATENSGVMRKSRAPRRSKSSTSGTSLRRSSRTCRSLSRDMKPTVTSTAMKPSRKSRSVSRTRGRRNAPNKYKTPMQKKKLENFAMVTPKMKPNTPSVVLRRPQQGEIAISLSGSPLMTTAMVSETTANVNIPLADGRIITIQPRRGLRASEIPALDPVMQKQLRTLRDNLDKFC